MNRAVRYAAAGIGVAALIGGAGTGIVMAQSGSGTSGTASTTVQALAHEQGAADQSTFITELAKNLGISEDALRAALKTTSLAHIDKALADGKITQAQADAAKTRIAAGNGSLFGFGGGHGGPGGMEHGGRGGFAGADVATFLGITESAIRTELQGGSTLAQVAANHGKSRDQIRQFLIDENSKRIDQAVTDGKITAADATTKKTEFATKVDGLLDSTGPKAGEGGPRGMGHGGPRPGAPSGSSTPSAN